MKYIVSYKVEAINPLEAVYRHDFEKPTITEIVEPPLKANSYRIDDKGRTWILCEGDEECKQ